MGYLHWLDTLLADGIKFFSDDFRNQQAQYIRTHQNDDGGFRGPGPHSDLYYTEFALRALTLLDPRSFAIQRAAEFADDASSEVTDVVDCFSALNCARLLRLNDIPADANHDGFLPIIEQQMLESGGIRRDGGNGVSAYNTFIGALCYEMLDRPMPKLDGAIKAIIDLQGPDGGYAEHTSHPVQQTNATAAAVCLLIKIGDVDPATARINDALEFLTSMVGADGGVRAHPNVQNSDLLSTFTTLVTLCAADALGEIDTATIGRYVKRLAKPRGGFRGYPMAPDSDAEYTYYGIGCLCLLSSTVESKGNTEIAN